MQKYLFWLPIILLLSGCAKESTIAKQAIREQEAIEAALEIASSSRPEMSGAQVPPSNIHAEQMSLDEAIDRIDPRNSVPTGYDPEMAVWFVTMEGIWFDEASSPTDPPTPIPYQHYIVIIDGTSGLGIQIMARP